jgi:hypothetical protein
MPKTLSFRLIQVVLCVLPFVPLTSLAYHYGSLELYIAAGAVQAVLILAATWILGLGAARRGRPGQRALAASAALLVAAGAVVSLGWNMGPPPAGGQFLATRVDQQFRYTTLLIGAILALGGLTVLRSRLEEAGDHVFSALGYTAIVLSTVLCAVVNAALQIGFEAVRQGATMGQEPNWVEPFRNYFIYLTVFWAGLAYVATACYSISLRKVGWMGKTASWAFVAVSLAAVILVALFPLDPGGYGLPGFLLSIPAAPYIMPYWMGLVLVRQAREAADA